jgi:PAS domain S-box-containing protein
MSLPQELAPESISELLTLALETASMAVWEWDIRSGRIQQRVSRALDLGYGPGVAPETVDGWLPHVHAEDRDLVGDVVARCLFGTAEDFQVRIRVEDRSGGYRWLQVFGRIAGRDERGAPVRFIGTTQDVHHLQTAEQTVRRDAELFNHIPDCIVCTNARGIIDYWNAGATALYGWSAEEMLGHHVTELLAASSGPAREMYTQREGGDATVEYLDRRKDGSTVWVEARFARYGGRDGEGGTLCFARDVSRRREAQELLLRDAAILSQLRDLVVCLDEIGHVTYWNDAAERILGWKREEILGKHVSARVPAAYAEQMRRGLARLFDGEVPPPGEWQDLRKDGSPVWIFWRSEPLRDAEGKTFGITAIGTDVTERRNAEDQRRKLEAKLFHAQKLESLGTQAGGIAHDFNSTLAVVLVYAEIALAHSLELHEDVREALEQIRLAGGRGRELVARLLTLGQSERAERGLVELRSFLQDQAKLLRATLPSNIALQVDAAEPVSVLADEAQLHQVLLNLSINAAHAMPAGGHLRLGLAVAPRETFDDRPGLGLASTAHAALTVQDDGAGISPELVERIFEPFFTTKPGGQGTGLGLATALAITKGHGGTIDVSSALGRGSLFTIYLPLATAGASAPAREGTHLRGRGQRVLIADDEEAVAVLMRTALEALGYLADCVHTPEELLKRYLAEPAAWQLLVIDQTLPRVSGLELAEHLRGLGHRTPLVLTSGFSRELTRAKLSKLEPAVMLQKPFDLAELGAAVVSALGEDSVEAPEGA